MAHKTQDTAEVSAMIRQSADKLVRHIRDSGMQPGDRYISAQEASRLVGGSITTAQRAMTFLAKRKWLERRPKAGTFIGSAACAQKKQKVVHFFLPDSVSPEKGSHNVVWHRALAVREVMSDISVQMNFVPNQDLAFVRHIVEQVSTVQSTAGFVVVLSSRPMRAYFNQTGVPAVILGSVEPDLKNLCWLSRDQGRTGKLLTEYLLSHGHKRIVTVMRETWSAGDYLLHDAIGEAMAEAGLPANALQIRSAAVDRMAITEMASGLLQDIGNTRLAMICRTEFQAECIADLAQKLELADRVEIVMCNSPLDINKCYFPCTLPDISPEEEGLLVGKMLREMSGGRRLTQQGYLIPVKLHVPDCSRQSERERTP